MKTYTKKITVGMVGLMFFLVFTSSTIQALAQENCFDVMGNPTGACNNPTQPAPTPTPTPAPVTPVQTVDPAQGLPTPDSIAPAQVVTTPIPTPNPTAGQGSPLPDSIAPAPSGTLVGPGNLTYVPLEPLPGVPQTGNIEFGALVDALFKLLIFVGGALAVGAFVYAGIVYMTSEAVGNKADAIKRLQAAFLGLLLLIGSWLILNTINPQLVVFNTALSPAPMQTYNVPGAPTTPYREPVQTVLQDGALGATRQQLQTVAQINQKAEEDCISGGGTSMRLPPAPGGGGSCLPNSTCTRLEGTSGKSCVVPRLAQ